MKKSIVFLVLACAFIFTACEKDNEKPAIYNLPKTTVPEELRGKWMYGQFSMTEYFNQDPSNYIGNGLEIAIAFDFEEKGNFTQYFTSSSVLAGLSTYQQSLSKGTVEIDPAKKTITAHTAQAHYKRTRSGQVLEERDLRPGELNGTTVYAYTLGVEPNGTRALYLKLGDTNPIKFLKK